MLKFNLIIVLSFLSNFILANNESPQAICPTIMMSGSDVSCYGQTDGSASVFAFNGSGTYTYTWSNGINTPNNPGLGVGTYTVNVKDEVSGCTIIGAFVVGSPDPISMSAVVTDVLCNGDFTGAINVTTIGGTASPPGDYSFSWSNGANTEDLTNIGAGNYQLNVLDDNGCPGTMIYTVIEPLEPIAGSAIVSDALCFGTPTGAINLSVWGGTPAYSYVWNSGQSTQDISNLGAAAYSVAITDLNGCTLNLAYNIGQPAVLGGTIGSTDVLCFGESTGVAFVNPTGGTAPYSYEWQNSINLFALNSATLTNIPADAYQVTVTDNNGCEYVDVVNVLEPAELLLTNTYVDVSCYGGNDGAINLTVTGGIPAYNYTWTNSLGAVVGTSQDLLTLVADIYSVEVVDNNGCIANLTQEIIQPNLPISTTTDVVDVLCFGENTGEIDLTASGGTPPFSFSWTSGQTTEDILNMLAGTYGYTVIDNNGCIETGSAVIDQPLAPLDVTFTITDVNCYGESNGSIDLTVTGGTAPYTFTWTNSTYSLSYTQEDLINFVADSYRFEVTDANGCTFADTLEINQPDELVLALIPTHVLCYGEATGSIDLTVVGGVLPYTYLWNTGFTTEDISSLIAGNYSVTVTDDHNCDMSAAITIDQPLDTMSFTFDVFNVECNNGTNGEIDLYMAGGTPPYTYLWTNGATTSSIENLTAGYYGFSVTDFNGCIFQDSIRVNQPDPFLANEVITPVSCYGGSDGAIDITPTGGTPPFAYSWFNSTFALAEQSQDLVDYVADVYQLEIVDSNGCFYEMFMEIIQPDSLIINYAIKPVTCYGWSDGAIDVTITGGNPPYSFTWSNGNLTEDLIDVISDTFQMVVLDTKGCTDTLTELVSQPDTLIIVFEHDPASCIDAADGVGYAYPQGGNGGYMYDWSNGATTQIATGFTNDYHYLTVTDVLGCVATDTLYITALDAPCLDPPNAFTPNGDVYNDDWRIDNFEFYPDAHLQVFNKWGNKVHEQIGVYEPWDGTINGSPAPSDTYYWIIHINYLDRESVRGNVTILR